MDTPLKHRLTGAIILVLLAVIVIPELLTGERNPQAAAASGAATPASAAPIRSYDIDLTDPAIAPAPRAAAAPLLPTAPASQPSATGVTPPAAAAAASGEFFVQLGSFAARDSAERLAADMRRKGFAVVVSPTRSGERTLHRVRVGPVGQRSAANALAERLRAAGHTGRIVSGA